MQQASWIRRSWVERDCLENCEENRLVPTTFSTPPVPAMELYGLIDEMGSLATNPTLELTRPLSRQPTTMARCTFGAHPSGPHPSGPAPPFGAPPFGARFFLGLGPTLWDQIQKWIGQNWIGQNWSNQDGQNEIGQSRSLPGETPSSSPPRRPTSEARGGRRVKKGRGFGMRFKGGGGGVSKVMTDFDQSFFGQSVFGQKKWA